MEKVFILSDNDSPGKSYATRMLMVKEIQIIELPGLQESEDIIDWVKVSDNNKERLIVLVKNTSAWTPKNEESQKGSFTLTKLGDLFQEPEEQTKWLTDRLLPTGGFSIIAAKPKVGKSTIARELALNVAKGESFLDRDVSTRIPASRTRKKRY